VAVVLCVLGVLAPSAVAAVPGGDEVLAPGLVELSRPEVRKLSHRAQAARLAVAPSGPGSLVRDEGAVLVDVRFEAGALGRLDDLRQAGAEIVAASGRYQEVTAAVAPVDLQDLSRVPGVGSVTPVPAPAVHAAGSCEGGSAISEGVGQLGVPAAREAFGLRGAGVTVGILSDSYDTATQEAFGSAPIATHAHEDVQSNDLTGPAGTCSDQQTAVNVLAEAPLGLATEVSDEGRAMTQVVHDIAPHAKLAFATAFLSELSFAQNIEKLAKPVAEGGAGAEVIVDDVSYFEEPFFQDGPVANAIAKVTSQGVTYLTAAGNENLFDSKGREIASWEAPEFRDAASCPTKVQEQLVNKGATPHCMDFDPGGGEDNSFRFTVKPDSEVTIDLQWAEPWAGVKADLDVYLVAGGEMVARKQENNLTTRRPVEWLRWANTKSISQEVELAINRCVVLCNPEADVVAKPRLKFLLMGEVSATEYPSSSGGDVVGPTIYGHAASTGAITLGAVPYSSKSTVEKYSSRGPASHYFGPVSGTTPAAEIAPAETIEKPDVVATDCGATTFFAQFFSSAWRFCGTSAAAPHAAAVAALMVQGASLTPPQVAAGLESSALPVGGFGKAAAGAGLISAKGALEAVSAAATTADAPSTTVPPLETEDEVRYEPEIEPLPQPSPTSNPVPPPVSGPTPGDDVTQPSSPATALSKHPKKIVETRRARVRVVFGFAADQASSGFLCQFDGSAYRACTATTTRWFGLGPHIVRAKAVTAGGVVDPTPAVFRFRVVRRR
jgi:hypothetical protein